MKKTLITFTILLSVLLAGCGINSTSSKALEEGKISIVSKEYEKARDLFNLAVNEDSDNNDAKSLLELTNDYIKLLEMIETGEFDDADNVISNIENNKSLDIIKDEFLNTKSIIEENKKKIADYIEQIKAIETLLSENKIDEAKNQATAKLEEVKGIKALENRLNAVITTVDEKIANAKAEILKYYDGSYDIKYENMEYYPSDSEIEELKGKAVMNFIEDQQYGSPKDYIYRMEDGAIFKQDQGSIYWVNNGNKEIYTINTPAQETTSNSNDYKNSNFTIDDAIKTASKEFEKDFPAEKNNYTPLTNGALYAGCYEVEFYDKGGNLYFATYAFDVKSGVAFRLY